MKLGSRLILALTLTGLALLGAGCVKHDDHLETPSLPKATVKIMTVTAETRLATEDVVGTVRPKLSAVIAAKLSGTIEKVLVVPGQGVKAGEWLVQLDAREIQARLNQALAVQEQTKNDIDRFTKLLVTQAVTQQEFDAVQARHRVAQGAVAEAETLLSHTHIVAPFDGLITRKYADVGDLATPGKPLLEIEDPRALRLDADVPEDALSKLKMGDLLKVRIASLDSDIIGTISEIAPAADPNSRTFLVKLDLPSQPGLRSGQFGRVAVPLATVKALRVPFTALVVRGQMELVFVATNNQAQLRLVKTGKHLGDAIELVSGIDSGEQIVVEGAERLSDGQPLAVGQ